MPDLVGEKIAYFGFSGLIDSNNATRIATALNHAVNNQFDSVYLCFSSNGGYVADGIYLYNHVRSLPIPVTMHNLGNVSSIAVAIFVAGVERCCSEHSVFMIHPTMVPSDGNMVADRLETSLSAALADDERTESILRQRTSIPADVLAARRSRDVYLKPPEALEYGLVQSVGEFSLPRGQQIIQI